MNQLARWGVDVKACSGRSMQGDGQAIKREGEEVFISHCRDSVLNAVDEWLVPSKGCGREHIGLTDGGAFHDIEL